jgi:hypothetical protein
MNRLDKYGYHVFKNMLISKDKDIVNEIFELRSQGMGMYDISDTLIKHHVLLDTSAYVNNLTYRKFVEDLMCCEGGVYDIILPKPKDGYNLDGMKNLAGAIVESAVEAYGYSLSNNMSNEHPASEKFFTSGLCDVYLGVFDVPMTGKDVMNEVKNRVANGARWR